jgi:predicted dehydrogenase
MKTIGVVGLGSIGLRHAKNLKALGCRVLGTDHSLEAAAAARAAGIETPEIMLINSLDGYVVALPTDQHCVELLELPRHIPVLVEKPIGWQSADLPYIKDVLQERTAPTMVGNNLRFRGCIVEAKGILEARIIGTPISAVFTLRQYSEKPAYLRDGVILNWGAHEIDLALHLLGPAVVDRAMGNDQEAYIQLDHENGCRTMIALDYTTKPQIRDFSICSTEGLLHADIVSGDCGTLSGNCGVVHYNGSDTFDENYVDEMKAFLDLIDGKPVPHAATGEDGLRTLEIILKAKEMAGI